MSNPEQIIDRQMEQYRRGQILGFTMAEIMLVLLFLLLLLLGARIRDLSSQLDRAIEIGGSDQASLAVLKDTEQELKKSGAMPAEEDVLWLTEKLALFAEEILAAKTDPQTDTAGPSELLEKLEKVKDLSNLISQNGVSMQKAQVCLKSCGSGPDACWGKSTSNPDFIYNVALYDDGVLVEPDYDSIAKNQEDWLALPNEARVEKATFLTNNEYRGRFGSLFSYARSRECIFQVRLFDADTADKQIYKSQRKLVEGYVYPTPVGTWPGQPLNKSTASD